MYKARIMNTLGDLAEGRPGDMITSNIGQRVCSVAQRGKGKKNKLKCQRPVNVSRCFPMCRV